MDERGPRGSWRVDDETGELIEQSIVDRDERLRLEHERLMREIEQTSRFGVYL